MREGDDHHVARGVGKAIQDDVAMLAAMDDFGVFVRKFGQLAEDAAFGAAFVLAGGCDVGVAPGGPEGVHLWGRSKKSRDPGIGPSGDLKSNASDKASPDRHPQERPTSTHSAHSL